MTSINLTKELLENNPNFQYNTETGCYVPKLTVSLPLWQQLPKLNPKGEPWKTVNITSINMIQQIKYYTPAIEDFKIGYECEWKLQRSNSVTFGDKKVYDWQKHIITQNDFDGGDMGDDFHSLGNSLCDFRTPYLTKERIEAEANNGFILEDVKGTHHQLREGVVLKKGNNFLVFKKYKEIDPIYMLTIFPIDPVQEPVDVDCHLPKYHGECKSINEFRTIMKLLEIS